MSAYHRHIVARLSVYLDLPYVVVERGLTDEDRDGIKLAGDVQMKQSVAVERLVVALAARALQAPQTKTPPEGGD